MSYVARLAGMDWEASRMLVVADAEEPIVAKDTRLNVASEELDALVQKVAALGEGSQEAEMATVAKKCWKYVKMRAAEDPIHISFFSYIPPLTTCNKVYISHHPAREKMVEVACADGSLSVSGAVFKVLRRESELFKHGKLDIAKMGIQVATLKMVLDHLCGEEMPFDMWKFLDLGRAFDLMTTASLLGIRHLAQKYTGVLTTLIHNTCKAKTVRSELEQRIKELKAKDAAVFENEVLVESFQAVIMFILDRRNIHYKWTFNEVDYSYLTDCLKELPIKSMRIGRQFDEHSRLSFGPEMPNLAVCPTIRSLHIDGWEVTKEGLESLLSLDKLEELTLHCCSFTPDALEVLPRFESLKSLELDNVLENKRSADVNREFLNERSFVLFGQCKNLTHLRLKRAGDVKDEWLTHLNDLPLETFKLNRISAFTGQGLAHLNPVSLRDLSLNICWELTKDGASQIGRFRDLTALRVSIFTANDDDLRLDIDPEVVNILPTLTELRKFKFNQRFQSISPEKVYTHLPESVEELEHWGTGSGPNWMPLPLIIDRVSRLKRWVTAIPPITPLALEEQSANLKVSDHLWTAAYKLKNLQLF